MTDSEPIYALATLLGAAGIWLLLPRGARRGRLAGAVFVAAALGLGASQMPWLGARFGAADAVFLVLASVTVVSAVAAVTLRNPVYCAVWFGLSLLGTAGLMLFLGAQFLAMATVLVYAGAILVTILFVLMLAQPEGKAACDRRSWEALLSAATGVVIVGILTMTVSSVLIGPRERDGFPTRPPVKAPDAQSLQEHVLAPQHVARIGQELFGRHLIAVEVAGVLLLVALVGAAVILSPQRTDRQETEDKLLANSQPKGTI